MENTYPSSPILGVCIIPPKWPTMDVTSLAFINDSAPSIEVCGSRDSGKMAAGKWFPDNTRLICDRKGNEDNG